MQNRNQSTANYSPATLFDVKKEFGEQLFEQASTDLVGTLYQAAKEKNEALLSTLLNYEVRIESEAVSRTEIIITKLFSLHTINGHNPIYLLAKQALQHQEPEIIDFLLAHAPNIITRYVVLAYAEVNEVKRVNAFLQESNDAALRHLAILGYQLAGNKEEAIKLANETGLSLPNDIQVIISSLWRSEFTVLARVNPAFLSRALLFFLKKENISLSDLVTHFNYGKEMGTGEELTIHIMLSFYNHYKLLQTLVTPIYLDKFGLTEEHSHKNNYISASVLGGSFEATCALLAIGCNFYDTISRTIQSYNFLLASRLIALNQQASYFKKTLPIKRNIPALKESATKEKFKAALNEIIVFTQEISAILPEKNNPFVIQAFNKTLSEKNISLISQNILRVLFDLLIVKNNIFIHQETIKLRNIIYTCLPLLDSHSLSDVLNKPLSQLLPSNELELKCQSSLLQHLAGSYVSYFLYFTFIISHASDIMYFVKPETMIKPSILTTQHLAPLSLVSLFVMHPLSIIPAFKNYPVLLQTIDAKYIFAEPLFSIPEKNEELGIESALSIALSLLKSEEQVVTFFLELYSTQMENHVSNPFLLSALLDSQAGKRWLKQHIHLLKEIPAISYEFLNIGQIFVSDDAFSAVILKDEQLINAFPNKYRDQFIQKNALSQEKKKRIQEENKKTLAQQTAIIPNKKESPKGSNELIAQLQKKGYELSIDFCITQENNCYTILFASEGDALANLRKIFKNPIKHVKLDCPHPKANIYQLSLSFPAEKLNHISDIIKTKDALIKHNAYRGAISQVTAKQADALSSQKSSQVTLIQKEKWQQAVCSLFCESPHIQITEAKAKTPSFIVTYTESGKDWLLKEQPITIRYPFWQLTATLSKFL